MNKFILILLILTLSSCTAIRIDDGKTIVTVEKDKPYCDINRVDPNCKIEGKAK